VKTEAELGFSLCSGFSQIYVIFSITNCQPTPVHCWGHV